MMESTNILEDFTPWDPIVDLLDCGESYNLGLDEGLEIKDALARGIVEITQPITSDPWVSVDGFEDGAAFDDWMESKMDLSELLDDYSVEDELSLQQQIPSRNVIFNLLDVAELHQPLPEDRILTTDLQDANEILRLNTQELLECISTSLSEAPIDDLVSCQTLSPSSLPSSPTTFPPSPSDSSTFNCPSPSSVSSCMSSPNSPLSPSTTTSCSPPSEPSTYSPAPATSPTVCTILVDTIVYVDCTPTVPTSNPSKLSKRCRAKPYSKSRTKPKTESVSEAVVPEMKKAHKRGQNRDAANRYRMKKRSEASLLTDEEQQLDARNKELREKADGLDAEVKYLKKLLQEIMLAKGLNIKAEND